MLQGFKVFRNNPWYQWMRFWNFLFVCHKWYISILYFCILSSLFILIRIILTLSISNYFPKNFFVKVFEFSLSVTKKISKLHIVWESVKSYLKEYQSVMNQILMKISILHLCTIYFSLLTSTFDKCIYIHVYIICTKFLFVIRYTYQIN